MKYILSILLLLTTPVVACASWGVTAVKSAAVSGGVLCTTSSEVFESLTSTNATIGLSTTLARGNSFTVPSAMYLSGFSIHVYSSGTGEFTLRWGTSQNLGTYEDEITGIATSDGTRYVDVDINNKTFELQPSTTYYWGVIATSGTLTASRDSDSDEYTNGSLQYSDGTGWNMAYAGVNYDLRFKVTKCTN